MYAFCAKQSKSQKTNGSKWPICFVLSVTVIQALFGCPQSVGQKMKTQAQRCRYGQTFAIDAHTPTQTLEYDE